jgi:hypothetical protein
MTVPLDNEPSGNEPPGLAEAEAVAATLVELGYSARVYPRVSNWGYQVVVTGKHGGGPRFRYVITDAAQLPKAIDDLARGQTGGDKALWEGV